MILHHHHWYNPDCIKKYTWITLINVYTPTIGKHKYIKQILIGIKGEIDSQTVTVGNLKALLTSMDKSTRQEINKETFILNNTLDQISGPYVESIPFNK